MYYLIFEVCLSFTERDGVRAPKIHVSGNIRFGNTLNTVEIPTSKDREIQYDKYYDTDTDAIVSKIEKVNQEMIRVLLVGASKSHICQKMVDNDFAMLFVCPTK